MAYNEKIKNNNAKYLKANQRRIAINWLKKDYENKIEPAIKRSGLPVSTFIKEAVREKIARGCFDIPEGDAIIEFIERLIRLYLITTEVDDRRVAVMQLEKSPTFKAIQGGNTAYLLEGLYSVFMGIAIELRDIGVNEAWQIEWAQLEFIDKVKKIGF